MIITVCYGTQKTWESREEAMSFFLEAMMSCDGSEKDRYCSLDLITVRIRILHKRNGMYTCCSLKGETLCILLTRNHLQDVLSQNVR